MSTNDCNLQKSVRDRFKGLTTTMTTPGNDTVIGFQKINGVARLNGTRVVVLYIASFLENTLYILLVWVISYSRALPQRRVSARRFLSEEMLFVQNREIL